MVAANRKSLTKPKSVQERSERFAERDRIVRHHSMPGPRNGDGVPRGARGNELLCCRGTEKSGCGASNDQCRASHPSQQRTEFRDIRTGPNSRLLKKAGIQFQQVMVALSLE